MKTVNSNNQNEIKRYFMYSLEKSMTYAVEKSRSAMESNMYANMIAQIIQFSYMNGYWYALKKFANSTLFESAIGKATISYDEITIKEK